MFAFCRAHVLDRSFTSRSVVVVAFAVAFLTLTPFLTFVPMWDGRAYTDCFLRAIAQPLSFSSLLCEGHPTILYELPYVLLQKLSPFSLPALHAGSLLLLLIAIVAFVTILTILRDHSMLTVEDLLLTLCFALQPIILGNVITPSPDMGLLAWFLVLLAALLRKRIAFTVLAGVFLVFTKETGAILYIALTLTVLVFSWRFWFARNRWSMLWLLLPLFLLSCYLLFFTTPGHLPIWNAENTQKDLAHPLSVLLGFNLGSWNLRSALASIYLLNYQWVFTVLTLLGGILVIVHRAIPKPSHWFGRSSPTFIVIVLLPLLTFLLTRYIPYTLPRYFFTAIPILLLTASLSLTTFVPTRVLRGIVLLGMCFLSLWSLYSTSDPLSLSLMRTLTVGERSMVRLCAGKCEYLFLRDQLIYSLEFTRISDVHDAAVMHVLKTQPNVPIVQVGNPWIGAGDFFDPTTLRRTLRPSPTRIPLLTASLVLAWHYPIQDIAVIVYPNVDPSADLASLFRSYELRKTETVHFGPYALQVLTLKRK